MPAGGRNFELQVTRIGRHRRGALARTYGRYAVLIDGMAQPALTGYMVEAVGPGDNDAPDNGRCIEAGRYPLSTHFGRFVSIGYSADPTIEGDPPMPAVRLLGTGRRSGILVHPAYPPEDKLYVASVGCLNPTGPLGETQSVDYWDSRDRTIALIEALRRFRPAAFAERTATSIPDAVVAIADS